MRKRRSRYRRKSVTLKKVLTGVILMSILSAMILAKKAIYNGQKEETEKDALIQQEELRPVMWIQTGEKEIVVKKDTEENPYYRAVKQQAEINCTKNPAQVNDPNYWHEEADRILKSLCEDTYYQKFGIDISFEAGYPYLIAVNRAGSTVTIYKEDENGKYTVPYMAMVCSGGKDTPLGYYKTPINYSWRLLSGPCYGQYATRIWSSYLFHSVPYYTQHKDDLEYVEYNKLGSLASLGCIRLAVVDVKWIYDNCPIGTKIIIYDDETNPGPMGKPGTIYIDPADTTLRGWDPTDPDPQNPWDDRYLSGTAIRSQEAQAEWEDAQIDSSWKETLNPPDFQGWSHDAAVVGTRG